MADQCSKEINFLHSMLFDDNSVGLSAETWDMLHDPWDINTSQFN